MLNILDEEFFYWLNKLKTVNKNKKKQLEIR